MKLSIRWKVTLGTLATLLFGLTVAGWFAIQSLKDTEFRQATHTLHGHADLLLLTLRPILDQPEETIPDSSLQATVKELSARAGARVTIIHQDGRVLAESAVEAHQLAEIENHGTRPEIIQALRDGKGTDVRDSATTGARTMYFALRITPARDMHRPNYVLRLGLPLTAMEREIQNVQRGLVVAFAIGFLASVGVSFVIARSLTRPISDMAAVARRLATGAPGLRVREGAEDEVELVAETLNEMTAQLELKIRELSEDRAQLLAMLTAMVEGVMVLDVRGVILQVNPALERIFLLSGAETRGRSYWDVIRHQELGDLVSQVLTTHSGTGGEITLIPAGRQLHVEASFTGSLRENEACVVLVFHDITELRRLEKVRKDFVANVSHELRTPLTSIKGYVEALLDGGKDSPDTAARFLDIILKQSNRLNLLLDDLLQLSQIESGQVALKREPVDLCALLERTAAFIKPLADKKQHMVTLALPRTLPRVIGDEERLAQVFTNLLDNAVKYTPDQGSIRIEGRVGERAFPEGRPQQVVEIIVADSGIGIPAGDRPRVFERFYRVDKARSRELGGTGLGLAIARHIIEGHGGQVWVEGNQPRGSRFIVRLPLDVEVRSPSPQAKAPNTA